MKEKVKKELSKLITKIIFLIIALWIIYAMTNKMIEQTTEMTESISADITAAESEADIKSLAEFSNGSAYLLETDNNIGIVSIDYTNTSGEVNSFASHYKIEAYQNGIQLEPPVYIENVGDEYKNRENGEKNIKDGIKLNIEKAFILENTEDDIEIEIYYYSNIYLSADELVKTFNVEIGGK